MSTAVTVRGLVLDIHREVFAGNLLPERARELCLKASALLGNVLAEITDADEAYALVLLAHLDGEEAANRAKIRAETTKEHRRKQEARNTEKHLIEMKRALTHYVKSLTEEMRGGV